MTSKSELYSLCTRINMLKLMQGIYLKIEHENDSYWIRVYRGEYPVKTLAGGLTPKQGIEFLEAFRSGLLFTLDFQVQNG